MILERIPSREENLVVLAQSGNQDARELIVEAYRQAVSNHARRMLHNSEDVEDAVQDTFVKAFRALNSFDTNRPLGPWLMRICTNVCVDIIRSRKQSPENLENHEHALADMGESVDQGAENRLAVEKLREAIGRLPIQYRDIIMMRHYRHMDVDEIATELGKPEGTIKSWLFRARAILKKDLQLVLGY